MYAFVVFLGLTIGFATVMQVRDEVIPVKTPAALTHTITAALAGLVCWALDYSVFASYGQEFRAEWMQFAASGIAIIGAGELISRVLDAVGGRMQHSHA